MKIVLLALLTVFTAGCTLGRECDNALDRPDLVDRTTDYPADEANVFASCWDADPNLKPQQL